MSFFASFCIVLVDVELRKNLFSRTGELLGDETLRITSSVRPRTGDQSIGDGRTVRNSQSQLKMMRERELPVGLRAITASEGVTHLHQCQGYY